MKQATEQKLIRVSEPVFRKLKIEAATYGIPMRKLADAILAEHFKQKRQAKA